MTGHRFDQVFAKHLGNLTRTCAICHELIEVHHDEDGIWIACECDAGYSPDYSTIPVDSLDD